MNRRRIKLHIERLVIHGEAPEDAAAFEAALQTAIEDRFATAGDAPGLRRDHAAPSLDGGVLGTADGAALGERIAHTILSGRGHQ